jgi:triosephosphate isomerase
MAAVKRVPLIAGNWKMNLDHLQAVAFVQKLAWTLKDANHDFGAGGSEVAVFPPFTDLRSVQSLVSGDKLDVVFGAQDVSEFDSGAYTGEISGAFLKALECSYVIIGHSERRTMHGETDEQLGRKVASAIKHGLVPVLCVGETADDLEKHGPSAVPVAQLKAALADIKGTPDIVIAYEPVDRFRSRGNAGAGRAGCVQAPRDPRRALRRRRRGCHAHPVRRIGQVGQHRVAHARAERRRRAGRRSEPGCRGVCEHRPLPEARRNLNPISDRLYLARLFERVTPCKFSR